MHKHTTGLSLGGLFVVMHVAWIIAVYFGYGDMLISWVEAFHFLSNVTEANAGAIDTNSVVVGVLGAAASGYIIGWVYAWLWNFFAGKKQK